MTVPDVTTTITARTRANLIAFLWDVEGSCPGEGGECRNAPCYAKDARALLRELGEHAPDPDDVAHVCDDECRSYGCRGEGT